MTEPKITCEIDEGGRIVFKTTNGGILLSRDEADRIAAHIESQCKRIAELETSIQSIYDGFGKAAGNVWTEDGLNGLEEPHINAALIDAESRMAALGLMKEGAKQ